MRKIKISNYFIIYAFVAILYIYLVARLIDAFGYFLNPDGYSYLTIAQKFRSQDFSNIIDGFNGLRGPVFSFISSLFLGFASYIKAIKLANAFTGIISIFMFIKFMQKFKVKPLFAGMLAVLVITTSVWVSLTLVAPDQILVALLLLYTYFLLDENYLLNKKYSILCAVVGFLAYLTKQYALYFFMMHFTLVNAIYYFYYHDENIRKNIFKFFVFGMGLFLFLCFIWSLVLSYHYKTFTIENASKVTFSMVLKYNKVDSILTEGGLIPPSNSTALNAWEDPILIINANPGEQISLLRFKEIVISNFKTVFIIGQLFTYSFVVVILFAVFLYFSSRKEKQPLQYYILLFSYLIFPVGYIFVHVEGRYLLYMYYLMLTMLGIMLSSSYFERFNFLIKLFVFGLIIFCIYKPLSTFDGGYLNKYQYDTWVKLSETPDLFLKGDSYASNDNYFASSGLVYQLKGQYYGQIGKNDTPDVIESQLEKYKIKYFVMWPDYDMDYIPHGFTINVTFKDSAKTQILIVKRY